MKIALWALGLFALGYTALVMGLYVAQRALLYHPTADRPRPSPGLSDGVRILDLPSHDGLGLFSWWAPPSGDDAPVIVYFHGNAGTQIDREVRMGLFRNRGWGVLMPGYRYNSGADGKPSEEALIADGRAVLSWLATQGIGGERVILYGESLGSGIATALAAEPGLAAGVVLDAPYDSIAAVARRIYWYVPVDLLLKDRFASIDRISEVRIPVLIGHGGADRIIPPIHGQRLFDAANHPKTWAFLPEADHVGLFEHGFLDDIDAFVGGLFDAGEHGEKGT